MKYAELVIRRQLQLRRGESLSINTESSTIDFARLLARLAVEVTIQAVQIVETQNGRIKQVYPIDPKENEALRPKISGYVMCHVVDLDDCPYYSEESPEAIAKDVVMLGRFGLLAEPIELTGDSPIHGRTSRTPEQNGDSSTLARTRRKTTCGTCSPHCTGWMQKTPTGSGRTKESCFPTGKND